MNLRGSMWRGWASEWRGRQQNDVNTVHIHKGKQIRNKYKVIFGKWINNNEAYAPFFPRIHSSLSELK